MAVEDPTRHATRYLTDGHRLLFVEDVHRGAAGRPEVVVENCATLEQLVFDISEFRRLGLRPVEARDD